MLKKTDEQEEITTRLEIHGQWLGQKDAKKLYLNRETKSYQRLKIVE